MSEQEADLTETTITSESVFEGSFLKVRRDTVRLPNGREGTREYVLHPGAVVVIAFVDDDHVVMVRQYRYPVRQMMLEFPAGKLDAGEPPLECAKRELLEETGYSASNWKQVATMHLAVGYSDEVLHIFVAQGLSAGERQPDEDEFLHVDVVAISDVLDACREGGITDAKSLSCTLWLQNIHEGRWQV